MNKLFGTSLNERFTHISLLIIRLLVSGFMLTHGIPKLIRLFSGNEIKFADPFGFGPNISLALVVFAEFFCSLLIVFGIRTRLATIPLIINMLVAAFYAHADDPFGTKEKPLVFAIVYFTLFVFGSGRYSIGEDRTNFN